MRRWYRCALEGVSRWHEASGCSVPIQSDNCFAIQQPVIVILSAHNWPLIELLKFAKSFKKLIAGLSLSFDISTRNMLGNWWKTFWWRQSFVNKMFDGAFKRKNPSHVLQNVHVLKFEENNNSRLLIETQKFSHFHLWPVLLNRLFVKQKS